MYTRYPGNSTTHTSYVRAIDLVQVVDKIFRDKMEYVKITIHHSEDDEDLEGRVDFSAIPSYDSNDVKKYPSIEGLISVEFDCY